MKARLAFWGSICLPLMMWGSVIILLLIPQWIEISTTIRQRLPLVAVFTGGLGVGLWLGRRWVQAVLEWWLLDAAQTWAAGKSVVQQSWQTEKNTLRWLGLFLLIGAGLRLAFLFQPIRTDEALTYLQFASKPLLQALSDYAAPNNHLFHTFWVHLSTRLFGDAEWAIRLPAFLAGILLIPMTYIVLRALYQREVALLAAALVTISSYLIEYSTNARGYTLQANLFLLCLWLAQWIYQRPRPFGWMLFVVCAALGFYTIPSFLYAYAALMLWLIWLIWNQANRGHLLRYWVGAGIATVCLTAILYMPVFLLWGVDAVIGNQYVVSRDTFGQELLLSLADTFRRWHESLALPLGILLVVGFGVALRYHARLAVPTLNLVYPLLLAVGGLLFIQRVSPFVRVWLYFLPLYLGVASAGIVYMCQRWQIKRWEWILAVLIMWSGFNMIQTRSPYTSIETGTFRDAAAVTQFLEEHLQTGDKVLYEHPSGESLVYYFRRSRLDFAYIERDFTPHEIFYVVVNTEYPQTAASVLAQNGMSAAEYHVEPLIEFPQAVIYLARQQ